MEQYNKVKSFKDLVVWQKSHALALCIYKFTEDFPANEKFRLGDQLRRASISVTSNIAEGFSRSTSPDKLHFLIMSRGSVNELLNQCILAKDLGYIDQKVLVSVEEQSEIILKLISGLCRSLKTRL